MTQNENTSDEVEQKQVECCGAAAIDAEAVPVDTLRELADNWREAADLFLDEDYDSPEKGAALQQQSCADQLEELANHYQR